MKIRMVMLAIAMIATFGGQALAQDATPTPGIVNLSPLVPTAAAQPGLPTTTPPPTQMALVRLEARDFANVRSEPSTESATLGQIRAGETYTVLARYAAWIQFQFPPSPDSRGWVFGELVNVTGDLQAVPEIDPYAQASSADGAGPDLLGSTPITVLTITSAAPGVSEGAFTSLPTFTYPPGIAAIAPTADGLTVIATPENPASGGTPPIVPILILGGLGLAGLAIGSLRR